MIRNLRFAGYCARTLSVGLLLGLGSTARAQEDDAKPAQADAEITLVRVNITTETRGASETVILNGRRIPNYHPKIIQVFPSTGIVLDERGHLLTFLGYRWPDVHGQNRRIEILTGQGRKLAGKMLGIDQSNGVAVVLAHDGGLATTPVCLRCEIRDGDAVVTPILEDQGFSQFESAQILSVASSGEGQQAGWEVTINRRLPGIGEPVLDAEHRVLGFIASQKPSPEDPMGMQAIIYPMTQLLTSAERIIQSGGDISTGWLGVYLDYPPPSSDRGVRIQSVLEGGPAHKAGLAANDILLKWNGVPIREALQLIRLVQDTPAGTRVAIEVVREGKPASISAVVGNRRPEESRGTIIFKFPDEIHLPNSRVEGEVTYQRSPRRPAERPRIGIDIVPLTPQLAEYLRMPGQSGLLVSAVEAKMAGAAAGVRVGDIIVAVDGRRFLDPSDFSSYVQSRSWGSKILLKLFRKGIERTAALFIKNPEN